MKILIVEDNISHQKLIIKTLSNFDIPLEIDSASSADECLEKVFNSKPDIILLDYNLGPGMNGIDIIKEIKEKGIDSTIIMVTGGGSEEVAVEAMKLGAYDYIIKSPGYLTLLSSVVKKAIEKRKYEMERIRNKERIEDLLRASLSLALFTDMNRLLEFILRLVCDTFEADGGSIMLYNKDTKELEVKIAIGERSNEIIGKKVAIGERIAGLAAQERKPILIIGDAKTHPKFKDLEKYEEIKSGITAIISRKEELIGVMNIKRIKNDTLFTSEDLNILSIFACHIATAIENMKIYNELNNTKIELEKKIKELEKKYFIATIPERTTIIIELARIICPQLENLLKNIKEYMMNIKKALEKLPQNLGYITSYEKLISELIISKNIIDNLLIFSNEKEMEIKPIDVNSIIEEIVEYIEKFIELKNISIIKDLDPRVPPIFGDKEQIAQAFINIILNSIESIIDKGEIYIKTKYDNIQQSISITIVDNGCGIKENDIEKVFSHLYTTKERKIGIGLYITKKIILNHKGTINLKSELNKGTEVTINLFVHGVKP
jgi:signal transduction histidine kinase/FixJ family two-component response regulator